MSMNRTLLLASFAVAAVGCAGAPEEIGESIAALGQTSCETAPRDEIATPAPCTCCVGGSRISSDASYGSALCPNQFLVGYGSFSGHAIGTAFWGEELPITELDCIQSHLTLGGYTETATGWEYPPLTTSMHGVWSGSSCSFAYDTWKGPLVLGGGSKHRLAGAAYRHNGSFYTYHKVGVRLVEQQVCNPPGSEP